MSKDSRFTNILPSIIAGIVNGIFIVFLLSLVLTSSGLTQVVPDNVLNRIHFRSIGPTKQTGRFMQVGVPDLKKFAKLTLEKLMSKNSLNSQLNLDFLNDALNYDACCISNIFENIEKTPTADMKYDIQKFISEKNKKLDELRFKKPTTISFAMNESQQDILTRSLKLYGATDLGVSRILTKVFVKKILRTGSTPEGSQKPDIQIKNSADWPYC